jgi:hypothetical protein
MAGSVFIGNSVWKICLVHVLAYLSWGRSVALEETKTALDCRRKSVGVRYDFFSKSVQNPKVIGDFERHVVDTVLSGVGSDRVATDLGLMIWGLGSYAANHPMPRCQ